MYMSYDNKPIGWWVKTVDRLLEESFRQVLAAEGLSRRHWQLLTAVGGGARRAELDAALAPFWPPDLPARAAEIDGLLADLEERGWLARDGDRITPTPDGEVARTRVEAVVVRHRGRLLDGIEPEQYQQVLATLARMAHNLA
jgi:hypothetical protein